jgi:hypothetical protein
METVSRYSALLSREHITANGSFGELARVGSGGPLGEAGGFSCANVRLDFHKSVKRTDVNNTRFIVGLRFKPVTRGTLFRAG